MADTLTFVNPTELRLSHPSKRANNVIFIPTPTSDSNLTKIMSSKDVYYTKGADTCNYRKVVTPKSSISGRNIDCNNESVKVYHVTHSGSTEVNEYCIDTGDAMELNFNVDGFNYGTNVINEDEISFNDGTNNIKLENFSNVSHTIGDGATYNNFSFSVPSNVSKVEINHNTDETNDQNKAKIIFDLDNSDSSKQLLYVNEKIGNGNLDIVTNVEITDTKNVVSYKVLQCGETMDTLQAVYFIEFGANNIFFASQKLPSYVYRLLVDKDLGDETNKHVYTFLGLDDENNFVLKYYNLSQTLKITDSNGKEVNLYNKLMTIEDLNTNLADYEDYTGGITYRETTVNDNVVIVPITFKYDTSVGKIVFYPDGTTFADSNNKATIPGLLSYCNEVLSACLLKTSLDDAVSSGKQFIKNTNYIINGTTTGNPNVISIFVGTETYSYSGATYNDSLIDTGKLKFSKLCEKILS